MRSNIASAGRGVPPSLILVYRGGNRIILGYRGGHRMRCSTLPMCCPVQGKHDLNKAYCFLTVSAPAYHMLQYAVIPHISGNIGSPSVTACHRRGVGSLVRVQLSSPWGLNVSGRGPGSPPEPHAPTPSPCPWALLNTQFLCCASFFSLGSPHNVHATCTRWTVLLRELGMLMPRYRVPLFGGSAQYAVN